MSGIITVMMIFITLRITKRNKVYSTIGVLVLVVLFLVLLLFGDGILISFAQNEGIIGDISKRFLDITESVELGDYQSATTNRTMLWSYYLERYNSMPFINKIFGSQNYLNQLIYSYYASHNSYIDILVGCGAFGLILFVIMFICNLIRHIRENDLRFVIFNVIFLINLLFRTFSGFSLLFPIMI